MIEYRLSWEMPDPIEVDSYEQLKGRDVWQRSPWESLHLTWREVVKVTQDESVIEQHATLLGWSQTREHPIRNVRLEKREVLDPEDGWMLVEARS